jgi:hypothetical protein
MIRFFENKVTEILDAKFDKEKGDITISGECNGKRGGKPKTFPGFVNEIKEGSNSLGKRRKGKNGKATIPDKFGIFDDC